MCTVTSNFSLGMIPFSPNTKWYALFACLYNGRVNATAALCLPVVSM